MELSFKINKVILTSFLLTVQFLSLEAYSAGVSDGDSFDFIVVGGGTAGCSVAARLAENGKHTVLLLEAGGLPIPEFDVPGLAVRNSGNPKLVKRYPTVSHRQAALAQNGIVNHTLGKMLGGSSGINGMLLNRGSPRDYNNWAKLTGDESWNYSNMLKYFRKLENYSGNYPSGQRGFNGPLTISRTRFAPGSREWLQGGQELGYQVAEPNGPQVISFTPLDFTRNRGRRVSSYNGYIKPMLQSSNSSHQNWFHSGGGSGKSNLLILINSEANRIIFEGTRAVGVKFTSNSTHKGIVRAKKEIIVTAGSIDSALLLMRSGVGPKSVLDKAHIPAVKYLPVGRNLHDHPGVPLSVVFGNKSAALDEANELTPEAWRIFNEYGDGPFTLYLGQSNQAFLTSSVISPYERHLGWPDIHLLPFNTNGLGRTVSDLRDWEITSTWQTLVGRPKSRGSVTLNPRDIDGSPVIDYGYLTHPDDIKIMVDGIKLYIKLCEGTPAFRRIGCRISKDVEPSCRQHQFRSDTYWECHSRQLTTTAFHSVGSCRMGSGPKDPEAVVDSKLRVIGIEGLRVADASVMPAITNGNTQAPVYAIAEKAADLILTKWNGVRSSVQDSGLSWNDASHFAPASNLFG